MNTTTSYQTRRSARGFSLVEAIITLLLVSIIIVAATAAFVQNQRITTSEVMRATLRSNLRYAVNVMAGDLRPVGAFSKWSQISAVGAYAFSMLECTNTNWVPFAPSGTNLGQYTGYDAGLPDRVRIADPDIINDARLYADYNPPSSQIKSIKLTGAQFEPGDLLIITDANLVGNPLDPNAAIHADLLVPTTIVNPTTGNPFTEITINPGNQSGGINPPHGLSYPYPSGSVLYKIRIWEYFIDATQADGIPRLYRREVRAVNSFPELVAEHVEDLQVALWLDTNNNGVMENTEWLNSSFQNLIANKSQLAFLRGMRITLVGRTPMVPEAIAGRNIGGSIYYQRPAIEDRTAGTISAAPMYREVYQEIVFLRNMRPPQS